LAVQMADLMVDDQASIALILRNNVVAMSNELKGVELGPNNREIWNIAEWYK